MLLTMSAVSTSATDRPRNTSAPLRAWERVSIPRAVAKKALAGLRSVRRFEITPLLSHIIMFAGSTPRVM